VEWEGIKPRTGRLYIGVSAQLVGQIDQKGALYFPSGRTKEKKTALKEKKKKTLKEIKEGGAVEQYRGRKTQKK